MVAAGREWRLLALLDHHGLLIVIRRCHDLNLMLLDSLALFPPQSLLQALLLVLQNANCPLDQALFRLLHLRAQDLVKRIRVHGDDAWRVAAVIGESLHRLLIRSPGPSTLRRRQHHGAFCWKARRIGFHG